MKPDRLEEYILENRSDFDDHLPSPESWEKIKTNIRPVRRINWTNRLVCLQKEEKFPQVRTWRMW